jgi:hypothetical protein
MTAKAPGARLINDDALELMSSGVAIAVATRDADCAPECTVGMGVHIARDRRAITVYVPRALAAPTLLNIALNHEIAINLSRPSDDKSLQVKGTVRAVRDSGPDDRAAQENYRGALVEQYAGVGVPRAITRTIAWWPSVAIEIDVRDVFIQTPGPAAGDRVLG